MNTVFKETDIEILIATMNRDSLDFLLSMFPFSSFPNFPILIINQTQKNTILTSSYPNVRIINSFEKGLSKSRNLALENAIGKILVIADDDIIYEEGFIANIIKAYNEFTEVAVISFCAVNSNGDLLKKYPYRLKKNLNIFDIFNTSSIEITLNKKILDTTKIRFDENFGLGGIFELGEEAIFLSDLKKENKQLVFVPEVIVKHQQQTSSDKKEVMERYYINGALFFRILKKNAVIWLLIKLCFDLKQKNLKLTGIKKALNRTYEGYKKFESIKYKNEK
ncbi:glycosyltransferase family 2 protein [Flavobacterium tructae]|uniref:glycosyltransferase family 2 protein n=1 Tax=Flavobacterium tructae TaxID=1114873 RepID=UPI0035A91305